MLSTRALATAAAANTATHRRHGGPLVQPKAEASLSPTAAAAETDGTLARTTSATTTGRPARRRRMTWPKVTPARAAASVIASSRLGLGMLVLIV